MYSYFNNVRADVLTIIPNLIYKSILEIGGGEFSTLKALGAKYPSELWGVDLYVPQAQGIHFVHGSVELDETRRKIPNDYFDLILANDVLEHLVDTELFLNMVFQKLRAGGYFVCSVPNARQVRFIFHLFFLGNFPRTNSGFFDRTHVRWFCRKDVIGFAQNAGLDLVDYGASGKLVPRWLQRSVLAEFLALQNLFVFCKRA